MTAPREHWVPIIGWEELYEISDRGRVRSKDRTVEIHNSARGLTFQRLHRGRVLAPSYDTFGYPMVKLKHKLTHRVRLVRCHTLVAEAFLGPRPAGMTVAHGDGNPRNPRLSNLRYATLQANFSDMRAHGTHQGGENHPMARLTKHDVAEIRKSANEKADTLAMRFGITPSHVRQIIAGRRWASVARAA